MTEVHAMRPMFAVALAASASACTLDMTEPDVSVGEQHAETHNKLAANKLAANKLAANKLAANKLAANSLESTRLTALEETSQILATAGGREVYAYIVSCALADGTTIAKSGVIDDDTMALADDDYCSAGDCVFSGAVGLATGWISHKLNPAGQGWVSACLFARVNNYGYQTGISLRGSHAALAISTTEAEVFTLQEGAFYGNVFTGIDRKTGDANPIEWNACRGAAEYEGNDAGGLAYRDCTEPDTDDPQMTRCGFHNAGDCADFSDNMVADPYACKNVDDAGNYDACATDAQTKFGGGLSREVITVYVSSDN